MKYNISNATAPAMPTLGKGTECIKLEGTDGYDGQFGGPFG